MVFLRFIVYNISRAFRHVSELALDSDPLTCLMSQMSIPFLNLLLHLFLFLNKWYCFPALTSHFLPSESVDISTVLFVCLFVCLFLVSFLPSSGESQIPICMSWYLFQLSVPSWHTPNLMALNHMLLSLVVPWID